MPKQIHINAVMDEKTIHNTLLCNFSIINNGERLKMYGKCEVCGHSLMKWGNTLECMYCGHRQKLQNQY